MKQLILSLSLFATVLMQAQTAPNFTANDCAAVNHDLYSELNSGKVIVISWVMPCSACIAGATAAQNAVNSFSASNPGQVLHYIADDYANTSCATLGSWCTTNSLNPNAKFSNAGVNMSGYGTAGMPKVVVLGGTSHTIYYNVNNASINQSNITAAINSALASTTGIHETSVADLHAKIVPNPANNELNLSFNSPDNSKLSIEIMNVIGQNVKSVDTAPLAGKNEIKINTEALSNGTYFLKISNGKSTETIRFIIAH
jgi:hypothetical protein